MKIALVGNPNSGKTTLFNLLTNLKQKVGNWPGVTIEKKSGLYHKNNNIEIIDLPGVYSLKPSSIEEEITYNYILNEKIDVVINIIDSTNLERNLFLTTQLLECDVKTIIALNMEDELKYQDIYIDTKYLSTLLGIEVVSISALLNHNIDYLMNVAQDANNNPNYLLKRRPIIFSKEIEEGISLINQKKLYLKNQRFLNILLLEKNNQIVSYQDQITKQRYQYIEKELSYFFIINDYKHNNITSRIDKIVLNKYLAFPIFLLVIFLMYFISFSWLGDITVSKMEWLFNEVSQSVLVFLSRLSLPSWLISLIVDGIIVGVGMVLSFFPQIVILFMFITFLESTGYMARVAFIIDRLFKKIGLSGKSFIPLIVGTGCTVPAIMSARTIENKSERIMTMILTPFIPCSAKLPVFALMISIFFPGNIWAAPSMYLIGIIMVILGGLILKQFKFLKSSSEQFILELPPYRLPKLKDLFYEIWEKGKAFVNKAGTIIFLASVILWFLQNFSWRLIYNADNSILMSIGNFFRYLFIPLGFGNYQSTIALITGSFAKETIISTYGILIGSENFSLVLPSLFDTKASVYAFLVFVLISSPCIASISTLKKELGSFKILVFAIFFQMSMAYLLALIINQTGNLLINHPSFFWTIIISSIIVFLLVLSLLKIIKKRKDPCWGCNGCNQNKNCKNNNL